MDKSRLKFVCNPLPRNPAKKRHKLTSVAYPETERIFSMIEILKLFPDLFIKLYYTRPSFCGIQNICITEPSDKGYASEIRKANPLQKNIAHGNIPCFKPCLIKC